MIRGAARRLPEMRTAEQGEQAGAGREPPRRPEPVHNDAMVTLRHLLRVEADIRGCASVEELALLVVNELQRLTGARQVYFVDMSKDRPRLEAVSAVRSLDRDAPTMRWLAQEIQSALIAEDRARIAALTLRTGSATDDEEGRTFPFACGHWFPITHAAGRAGGILALSDQPLQDGPVAIATRVAATASHAAKVLGYRAARRKMSPRSRLALGIATVVGLGLLAWPVPMTALAPMEIAPRDAFVVAAPVDGVIDDIVVAPNAAVKAGELIVRYVDTVPRNQLLLAEREVSVADAKLRQLQQTALVDDKAKRELAQARAELSLKFAERDFARETFERSQIRSPRDGVAIYADRKEWVGKPVSTGQRILEIANVDKVQVRAQLPVGDILDLKPGARLRAFLDGDPLHPVDATISLMSHQARVVEGQGLAYRVEAQLDPAASLPRLGVRGTAQLYGERAPLVYYLFRRPLIWLRQKAGL